MYVSYMSHIGPDELVFNNDDNNGIHTGGFSVNSIMMKNGISPIMTINKDQTGGSNLVSDIFNNLVVPNWALSYKMTGGDYKDSESESERDSHSDDSDSDDDFISDDLHDKLLDLVKEHDAKTKQTKKRATRRQLQLKKGGGTKKKK